MKALILAAGTGTRLRPLTDTVPKALLEVAGHPLIELVIRKIAAAGITSLVVNVHHFPEQIIHFLGARNNFGLDIQISDETENLLDTGGALKKASTFFSGDDTILVHNVDILSDLNISDLLNFHKQNEALVTLAVKKRPTSRSLLVDSSGRLCGWEYPEKRISILTRDSRKGLSETAFSGVYAVSASTLKLFPSEDVFGLIPWILDLAHTGKVMAWDQSPAFWYEAGRPESIEIANRSLAFDPEVPSLLRENP